jgi:hypothetical protein
VFPVRYGLYLCVPYGSHNNQRLFQIMVLLICRFTMLYVSRIPLCFKEH